MRILSEMYAEFLALIYVCDGEVAYNHINKYNMWEFSIEGVYGTLYKTKGLR